MGEEDYFGGEKSRLWFRARANCLWHGGAQRDGCGTCGGEEQEDLKHFLLDCGALEGERGKAVELQRPRVEKWEEAVGLFLFERRDMERKERVLQAMWHTRHQVREER